MRKPEIETVGLIAQALKETMATLLTHLRSTLAHRSGKIHNQPVNNGHFY